MTDRIRRIHAVTDVSADDYSEDEHADDYFRDDDDILEEALLAEEQDEVLPIDTDDEDDTPAEAQAEDDASEEDDDISALLGKVAEDSALEDEALTDEVSEETLSAALAAAVAAGQVIPVLPAAATEGIGIHALQDYLEVRLQEHINNTGIIAGFDDDDDEDDETARSRKKHGYRPEFVSALTEESKAKVGPVATQQDAATQKKIEALKKMATQMLFEVRKVTRAITEANAISVKNRMIRRC